MYKDSVYSLWRDKKVKNVNGENYGFQGDNASQELIKRGINYVCTATFDGRRRQRG